ncbi:hypothetical protein [Scytonema sp. UIC 10036]|uniref:hypothetical protein n=1 Tax=Scytonema sp. UIC 10036 TaxID=2304196 RepID=UPI001FA95021|nr:hypothetical protein [Scytonema sp. UIC 10036]
MPIITWELWLARDTVLDNPLLRAKINRTTHPWKGCLVYGRSFGGDWISCKFSKTPWKISWLENRKAATT